MENKELEKLKGLSYKQYFHLLISSPKLSHALTETFGEQYSTEELYVKVQSIIGEEELKAIEETTNSNKEQIQGTGNKERNPKRTLKRIIEGDDHFLKSLNNGRGKPASKLCRQTK